MKVFRCENDYKILVKTHFPSNQVFRFLLHLFLDFFSFPVGCIKNLCQFFCFFEVERGQKMKPTVGLTQTAGGIEPWTEGKSDRTRTHFVINISN